MYYSVSCIIICQWVYRQQRHELLISMAAWYTGLPHGYSNNWFCRPHCHKQMIALLGECWSTHLVRSTQYHHLHIVTPTLSLIKYVTGHSMVVNPLHTNYSAVSSTITYSCVFHPIQLTTGYAIHPSSQSHHQSPILYWPNLLAEQ